MAAHRYWRLRQTGGGGCWSISDLQFHPTVGGGVDLTDGAGGVAYADSVYNNDVGSYGPQKAFDGDGSIWHNACPGASGSWIGYYFNAPVEVKSATIAKRGAYPEQQPNAMVLEWSDDAPGSGASWTPVSEVTGINWFAADQYGDTNVKTFSFIAENPLANSTALSYNGDVQTYTVPPGATTCTVRMWGGGAHGGQYGGGSMGGGGGHMEATFPVTPGDVLGFQVAEGGRNASGNGYTRGRGGWPDGGSGSRGDTWGGGGGGSSRVWLNGAIRVVAGGGGGAAGYAGNGGGGGGQAGADGQTAPVPDPNGRPGQEENTPFGWKRGRSILQTGAVGRTGGFGGWMLGGTGDDGAGGGGGYYGGGGGGGDGRSGGGGLSWAHPSCTNVVNVWGSNAGSPGKSGSPDYAAGVGAGKLSNTQTPGGDGRVVFCFDNGAAPIPGGGFGAPIYEYIFDRPADSYQGNNVQGKTLRCAFNASARTGNADTWRLNIRGAGAGTNIIKCFVGIGLDDNNVERGVSFSSPPTQVFFNGQPGIEIGTDVIVSSDVIDLPLGSDDRLVVSIYLDPTKPSYHFIGGSGDGYDFEPGDAAGGRGGNYRYTRYNGDVAAQAGLMPNSQETWDYWNFLESIQAITYSGEEPEPEPTGRRKMIVVT